MTITPNLSLEELLNRMDKLPEIPAVALQVSRLLNDPKANAKALGDIIVLDPALVAQVLKICNSAQYALNRKIATISEAVAILGQNLLKQIIYTIISHGVLNRPIRGYAMEKGALWQNSMTCAVYARHLAHKLHFKDGELAFTASVLRDIGKIAMDSVIDGLGQTIERTVYSQKCSFLDAEEQIVGFNHCIIGAHLASRWNLPESLVLAIEFHHQPSQLPVTAALEHQKLVCIVHLADIYTMMTGAGMGLDGLMYPLDSHIFDVLGINPENNLLDQWYAELLDIQGEIDGMSKTFSNA